MSELAFRLQKRIEEQDAIIADLRVQIVRLKDPVFPPTCCSCGATPMGRDFTVYGMTVADLGAIAERGARFGQRAISYMDGLEMENESLRQRLAKVCDEWAKLKFPDTTGV